jgi:hypothetical protein
MDHSRDTARAVVTPATDAPDRRSKAIAVAEPVPVSERQGYPGEWLAARLAACYPGNGPEARPARLESHE